MTDQELLAIKAIIREEIAPLKKGQEEMKADITELKEGQEEIRNCVNALLEWSDKISEAVKFPLPRV